MNYWGKSEIIRISKAVGIAFAAGLTFILMSRVYYLIVAAVTGGASATDARIGTAVIAVFLAFATTAAAAFIYDYLN